MATPSSRKMKVVNGKAIIPTFLLLATYMIAPFTGFHNQSKVFLQPSYTSVLNSNVTTLNTTTTRTTTAMSVDLVSPNSDRENHTATPNASNTSIQVKSLTSSPTSRPQQISVTRNNPTTKFDDDEEEEVGGEWKPKLNVPFYIYENGLNWWNITLYNLGDYYYDYKHSDDYWLLKSAREHPQRVLDPSKAKLFFVPTLLNAMMEDKLGSGDNSKVLCLPIKNGAQTKCGSALWRHCNKLLGQSPWFKRNQGRDHILVYSHFPSAWENRNDWNFMSCNLITFENLIPNQFQQRNKKQKSENGRRLSLPNIYIGQECGRTTIDDNHNRTVPIERTADFVMVATLKPDDKNFQTRGDICTWLNEGNFSTSNCGIGKQCPALAQAKYGFHVRGDTWGSNRIIDLALTGTIPLFTNEAQYEVLPDFIPFRDFSYLVNVTSKEAFYESLKVILKEPESEYIRKRDRLEQYRMYYDHSHIARFDGYMTAFAEALNITNKERR